MRIVCQKCSAAYAIDDKFVTPKGVRAQCPRCRHLQLVKKEEAPAAAPAPAPEAPAPFLFDLSQPTEPNQPIPPGAASGVHFGSTTPAPGAAPSPFDFGAPPPPAPNPFDFGAPPPPPPPPAPASPGGSPFDFSASPASFTKSTPGIAPAPGKDSSLFDFGAPVAPPPPSTGSPFEFSGAGAEELTPPTPDEGASGVRCASCGKVLADAFDQALGMCDECRNRTAAPVEKSAPAPVAPAGAASQPAPAPAFPTAPSFPPASETPSPRQAMRQGRGSSGRMMAFVGGAVVLVGVAAVLAWKRPWVSKPPPLVVKAGPDNVKGTTDSLIAQWKLKYVDLDQRTEDYVDEGEESLARDTTQGYRSAEESFEQALVLSPGDTRALSGWVLSLAFGRAAELDEPTVRAAEAMLNGAEQKSDDSRLYVAHAHFLISRAGNPNDIKVLAERGLQSRDPHQQALASLALGQTLLGRNPQQAEEHFDRALKLDPKLKRAYLFQAQFAVSQGHYKAAATALEKRLELDADQWAASEELARLLVDVGEPARAKKVLEAAKAAAPGAGRPRLGLAVFAYQHQSDYGTAEVALEELVADAEQPASVKAEALLHLGTVLRITGYPDEALASLDRSVELAPDQPGAKLQRLLVLLDKGVISTARLELDGLKGKLGDKHLEDTIEGRLMIAEGRLDDALATLSRVVEADPRRVDATFLAGAAAAKGRKDGKAWEFCLKRGLRADVNSRPVASLTSLYVRPADLLKPAVGAYLALVKNVDDDPSAPLCEGLVAWFSEEPARADREFARAIHIDPRNTNALAYRSLAALRRREVGAATSLAARAVAAGKTNGNAWLAQAMALMAARKPDKAKVAAQSATRFMPQSLGAKVLLASVEASRGNTDDARRTLTSVLLSDASYRDAKRALYEHKL